MQLCLYALDHLGLKLRTFGRIRRYLNLRAALTVYESTILPIIDYNDLFQALWNADKLHKLQKIQNWGLRLVNHNIQPRLGEADMHNEANLTLLNKRRVTHLLNLMYMRSKIAHYIDHRDIATRPFAKVKFKVLNPVVKKAFKSPNYLGALYWDTRETVTAASMSIKTWKGPSSVVLMGLITRSCP